MPANFLNHKRNRWHRDGLLGVILGLGVILIAQTGWLQPLHRLNYQQTLLSQNKTPHTDILLLTIDDSSLHSLGGHPLPPALFAQMLQTVHAAQPKLIASTVFFSRSASLDVAPQVQQLVDFYAASSLVNVARQGALQQEVQELGRQLHQLHQRVDGDKPLRAAMQAARLWQAVPFELYAREEAPAQSDLLGLDLLPASIGQQRLAKHQIQATFAQTAAPPRQAAFVMQPMKALQDEAIGFAAWSPGSFDKDFEPHLQPLIVQFQADYYPTLPLLLAAQALGVAKRDIRVTLGSGVQLGDLSINTDAHLQLRPQHYAKAFPRLSLSQILQGDFSADEIRDKIVLIGFTASSQYLPRNAIANAPQPPLLDLARSLSSLLQADFLSRPNWLVWLEWCLVILVVLYLSFILPRLGKISGLLFTAAFGVLLWLGQSVALQYAHLWLSTLLPVFLLLSGYLVWWLSRLWLNVLQQAYMSQEGVEANRQLGLAYQGQGRLEQAFEKFSHCPLNDDMLGLLYNLALDFERKGDSKEAVGVYRFMAQAVPDYRDIEQRVQRLQAQKPRLQEKRRNNLSDWLEANSELRKPMLGRYQVEKKLGKGAMGVVYLGKDAKMDRMVALKTLSLSNEFEGDALHDATRRFFREASAAGRLTHEHIVAVYDAGEEDQLAYIAMEFFKGSNLTPYTQKDHLLPLDTLFDIAIHAAEALQYAHSQGVVHRDIKPANIMYNPGSGKIKLTDFGIARITDSNKTKTGVILGTPSFMAPEQLAGKVVDGRADLFSLGVTLYQLLTGSLPFTAESMASLMFKITSEAHPRLREKRADLTACMQHIIDTLLAKDPDQRYADGVALAYALRACRDDWIQSQYRAANAQPSNPQQAAEA